MRDSKKACRDATITAILVKMLERGCSRIDPEVENYMSRLSPERKKILEDWFDDKKDKKDKNAS